MIEVRLSRPGWRWFWVASRSRVIAFGAPWKTQAEAERDADEMRRWLEARGQKAEQPAQPVGRYAPARRRRL